MNGRRASTHARACHRNCTPEPKRADRADETATDQRTPLSSLGTPVADTRISSSRSNRKGGSRESEGRRTYVLDTSVLLSDPKAAGRFAEHHVVLPLATVLELEKKRNHLELGWAARAAIRWIEKQRETSGSLANPIPIGDQGGTLKVALNHQDKSLLPAGMDPTENDHRILMVALSERAAGASVVLVTKDLPLRLKASAVGLDAEGYRNDQATGDAWTGVEHLDADKSFIDELYAARRIALPAEWAHLPANSGLVLRDSCGSSSALARIKHSSHREAEVLLIPNDQEVMGVHGRSAEQRIAIAHLLDPDIDIVSLGGIAGSGKSTLAIMAGLEQVLEDKRYRKVMVFRPLNAVGGQELGYLPGDVNEKMAPHAQAVYDVLDSTQDQPVREEIQARGMLEISPVTYLRGRSLANVVLVVDESQNLEHNTLVTALSRMGEGTKGVLCFDERQRDNAFVGRHDGVVRLDRGRAAFVD